MKKTLFITMLLCFSFQIKAQTAAIFFEQTNEFLKKNVNTEGKVDYATLKKSPGELLYILSNISKIDAKFDDKNTAKAFWINVYNLQVIRQVLENFPLKTVNDIPGFFKENNFMVASQELTLDDVENTILREIYVDPGIHFALCSGSNGSAPLLNGAYMPTTVDAQMKLQAKNFINSKGFMNFNKDTKTVIIPKIFEWYKKDFVTAYFNEIDFLNIFLEKKLDPTLKMSTYEFDWTLNQK